MANREHLDILNQGVAAWNQWRNDNRSVRPELGGADLRWRDLRGVDFSGVDLSGAILFCADLREADFNYADLPESDLSHATLCSAKFWEARLEKARLCGDDLREANLDGAYLAEADLAGANCVGAKLFEAGFNKANLNSAILRGLNLAGGWFCQASLYKADLAEADLHRAFLEEADLSEANLCRANLRDAHLTMADLRGACFTGADLRGADLSGARLLHTKLDSAKLDECSVYGISAWDLDLSGASQKNLVITPNNTPTITVDELELAQFVYLLLNNANLRNVINTVTSKVVLILGRFTPERKAILDLLREQLRRTNYVPILFDFEIPHDRDVTETVTILARMARFIVADLTEPSSIPHELQALVPDLAVPVQPLIEGMDQPFSMFKDYWKYHWVLKVHRYKSKDDLLNSMIEKVIAPAETKARELTAGRTEAWAE